MMDGVATPAEAVESLRIFWSAYFPSAYFPSPDRAPAFPDLRVNTVSAGLTLRSAVAELPGLAPGGQ